MAITKKNCIILLNLFLIIFRSPAGYASFTELIKSNSCAIPFSKDIFHHPKPDLSKIFKRLLKPLTVGRFDSNKK